MTAATEATEATEAKSLTALSRPLPTPSAMPSAAMLWTMPRTARRQVPGRTLSSG